MSREPAVALLAMALVALASGCESTQDRSARLEKTGAKQIGQEKGVVVSHQGADVKVLATAAIGSPDGAAAVVRMRNVGSRALVRLPISVNVKGGRGRSLYRNDQAGLERSLVSAPLVRPGQTLWWVNDQVTADGRPRSVSATVGEGRPAGGSPPDVVVTKVRLSVDPVSGVEAKGFVRNRSAIPQRLMPIFAVALKGGRVVAAGRAIVERLRSRASARFSVFFIGDPRGARLEVAASPTVLSAGGA